MSTKHTPGPWLAKHKDGKYRSDHEWNVGNDADSVCVSEAAPIWGGNQVVAFAVASSNFYQRQFPHIDANARLISAAPDMLTALMVAEGSVGDMKSLEIVRAAIARATGEQL